MPARVLRLSVLWSVLLAIIIVPFVLFGDTMERWVTAQPWGQQATLLSAALGIALLASDVVLPIPSSLVGTALGAILGAPLGTLAGTVGLTAGCIIGYALGAFARVGLLEPFIAVDDRRLLESWLGRHGVTVLVLCRAIPVLAETSVIVAGLMRMPPAASLLATGLANLGISAVYAGLGSFASDATTFAVAFLAAILLPGGVLLASYLARRGFAKSE
jgi:membrane protein DedA with SNARE-associated domain